MRTTLSFRGEIATIGWPPKGLGGHYDSGLPPKGKGIFDDSEAHSAWCGRRYSDYSGGSSSHSETHSIDSDRYSGDDSAYSGGDWQLGQNGCRPARPIAAYDFNPNAIMKPNT